MRRGMQFSEMEWVAILSLAAILAVFAWFTTAQEPTPLDPVSRAVTALLTGVAAALGGAVALWAIKRR